MAKGVLKGYKTVCNQLQELEIKDLQLASSYCIQDFNFRNLSIISGYISNVHSVRNQVKSNSEGLQLLKQKISAITDHIKTQALDIKNTRTIRHKQLIDDVLPWAENHGLSTSVAEDTIDGIFATQDQSLSLMRNVNYP